MPQKGDAGFKYDAGAGEITVALNRPLWRPKAAPAQLASRITALDLISTTAVTYADEAWDVWAYLRMVDNPAEVAEMLRVGKLGVPLDYYPSLADALTFARTILVEPLDPAPEPDFEPTHLSYGYVQYRIRLRRIDGGNWSLLPGSLL